MKVSKILLAVSFSTLFIISSFLIQKDANNSNIESLVVLKYPKTVVATETKFSQEVIEENVVISFKTEYVDDPETEIGTEKVIQEGKYGKKILETAIVYYDGEEYEQRVEEKIAEEPVDEIIARGTKIVPKTLDTEFGGITYIQKFSDFWATSYDSTCPGCSETTAIGMKQGYGVVAVDPELIPLRSELYIPGYGIAVAGDVGGSIKGKRIDLGFDSLNGQWKARYVDVYLLID